MLNISFGFRYVNIYYTKTSGGSASKDAMLLTNADPIMFFTFILPFSNDSKR